MAAIYARVSSDQQREANTIASQTSALIEFAHERDLEVPDEWVFEDDGYTGATLERPGLERVRDLAAEGQIQVVLAYSPDRLSRKYAYQILLIEELARNGVETIFVKAPQGASAEDQLLVQFQGMISEYERAQILERSRRGKRHRAQSGEVSVMSGAPYGYRYIRKTNEAPAAYAVLEAEARVVERIYEMYTVEGLSIGEITRRLNAEGIPTRKASARWERTTVWAVLRNSAYRGIACFGKTRASSRTRVMRPQRRRGVITPSMTAGHERPRDEWIEIPVPALVSEDSFTRAQELLEENKVRSRRRTIEPSIVQGLVSCQKCGYAFSRSSTQTSARKIHYYKCIGSDSWRKLGGPVCDNSRMIRQDLLDQIVWAEVIKLLEDSTLIQQELDRRLAAARSSDPTKKREQSLQRELVHVGKGIERLLSAYQEALMSIEQLRERMPGLRQREQALRAELQAIADQANDRAAFLRLAENLTAFLARLRGAADTLSITERQRIVRLVVKDVLIGDDSITIRHSISVPQQSPTQGGNLPPCGTDGRNYLLCKGSGTAALRRPFLHTDSFPILQHARVQPLLDEPHDAPVRDAMLDELDKPFVRNRIEKAAYVQIEHPVHLLRQKSRVKRIQRIMLASLGTESVREAEEVRFVDSVHHLDRCALNDLVLQRSNSERSQPPVGLGDVHPTHRLGPVRSLLQPMGEVLEVRLKRLAVVPPRLPVHAGRGFSLHTEIGRAQRCRCVDVVKERGEPHLLILACCLTYPLPRTGRVVPALCPGRVLLKRISLGQTPSLHPLRHRLPEIVRGLHRYYRSVRLPVFVHHRRTSSDFPMRPRASSALDERGTSRFPSKVFRYVRGVCDHAGLVNALLYRRIRCCLPPLLTASASRRTSFSRLNTRPAPSPVNASQPPSRATPHDSEPVWFAKPSLYETFIHNTSPV
jgi:site-specific DNA recombinase